MVFCSTAKLVKGGSHGSDCNVEEIFFSPRGTSEDQPGISFALILSFLLYAFLCKTFKPVSSVHEISSRSRGMEGGGGYSFPLKNLSPLNLSSL